MGYAVGDRVELLREAIFGRIPLPIEEEFLAKLPAAREAQVRAALAFVNSHPEGHPTGILATVRRLPVENSRVMLVELDPTTIPEAFRQEPESHSNFADVDPAHVRLLAPKFDLWGHDGEREFGFGLIPDDPSGDARDLVFSAPAPGDGEFITRNRDTFHPEPLNQLRTNYCANFATIMAVMHAEARQTGTFTPLSPLFNGFYSRSREERVGNTGTMIRSAFDAVRRCGVPAWDAWPLEVVQNDYLGRLDVTPDYDTLAEAARHQSVRHYRTPDFDWGAIHASAKAGYGTVIGIPWYEGYDQAGSRPLPVPGRAGRRLNYHAIYILDFDVVDGQQVAVGLNSWGKTYGFNGYFYAPLETLQTAQDNWVCSMVETVRRS